MEGYLEIATRHQNQEKEEREHKEYRVALQEDVKVSMEEMITRYLLQLRLRPNVVDCINKKRYQLESAQPRLSVRRTIITRKL